MGLRAPEIMRRNVTDLLLERHHTQTDLASWLGRGKSWINKFLNGHREIRLTDLDRIADFFGLATYQLFQPGIGSSSERRSGRERRCGRDRRVGHAYRMMGALANEHDKLRRASQLRGAVKAGPKRGQP